MGWLYNIEKSYYEKQAAKAEKKAAIEKLKLDAEIVKNKTQYARSQEIKALKERAQNAKTASLTKEELDFYNTKMQNKREAMENLQRKERAVAGYVASAGKSLYTYLNKQSRTRKRRKR
jgi:hypothetical protein